MGAIGILQLVISLLGGVSTAFGKAGLAEAAAGIEAAVEKLQEVHDTVVTKSQVEGLKITPQW